MALTNVVNAVPLNDIFFRIDINGKEHIFIENKSGSIVHIIKDQGVLRVVQNILSDNDYVYTAYSQTSNCFYFCNQNGGDLLEYNPDTGEVHNYALYHAGLPPYYSWSQFPARSYPILYIPFMSTGGDVYLGTYTYLGISGYVKFNVTTKEFDERVTYPDKEFTHIYGRINNEAMYIDNGALAGVYSTYRWSEPSDGYIDLRDTVLAEIATAGLAVVDVGTLWIHQDDRSLVSATRRIIYNVGTPAGSKIIDIKNPSTWINRPANTDQTGTPVNTTNWITGVKLYDLAVQAGLTVPTLGASIAYCVPQKVGRYVYVGHYYLGNKTHFFTFAIHPVTEEAMYPYSFNKYETYLQNGRATYKCNFRGDFGFSSDDEIVNFLSDNVGNWYFIRPDNHTFQIYNPVTDADDYVIREVNLNNINDPDGFGVFHESRFSSKVVSVINGEDWYVNNLAQSKAGLAAQYLQEFIGTTCNVTYRYMPDKSKPEEVIEVTAKGLSTNTATLSNAVVIDDTKIACVSQLYDGVSFIDVVDENTYTLKKYFSGVISPDGAVKIGNYILVFGYSGSTNIYDISDWDDIKKFSVPSGPTNEVMYMVERPEGVLSLGQSSRSAVHHEGCAFSLVDLSARTVTDLTNLFPNEFKRTSAVLIRNATGMSGASYNDAFVETRVQAYMLSSGKTRAQVIAEFLDTSRWHNADAHTYGNKTVVGLAYEGVLSLNGIRIEQTVGSGIWIDRNYYQNEGGKALLIDTANILTVSPSEIKPVQFNLTPNVQSMGRVAGSTNYLAFIINDEENEQGFIRIVSKVAFEAAANGSGIITTIPTVVTIDFGGVDGFGFGDADDFDQYDTHCSNAYFCEGDDLYITCRSNINEGGGLYACVIKVDLATGSSETFVKSATRVTRAISYDGTRMLITNGTSLVINDNFTSQVGSITI